MVRFGPDARRFLRRRRGLGRGGGASLGRGVGGGNGRLSGAKSTRSSTRSPEFGTLGLLMAGGVLRRMMSSSSTWI